MNCSSALLNRSSSDAPHEPTNLGFEKVGRSCISTKPLPRKKLFILSKWLSPP
ncbi:Uncharacterised protein [Vibrio cholerae]|nr:Uncharacterised protein [Vibrio cholerae]